MQFTLEKGGAGFLVQKYSPSGTTINDQHYTTSLIVLADEVIPDWPVRSVADLTLAALEMIIDARPEVLLLGTGSRQVFPPAVLLAELAQRQRSIEVMDNAAACRTFTVLSAELRQVALALIMPG